MFTIKILLTVLLLPAINCKELEWHPLIPHEYVHVALLSGVLLLGGIIRQLIIKYNIPVVAVAFLIVGGLIWGVFAYYNAVARLASRVIYMNPHEVLYVLLPILVFNATFSMDTAVFIKTLPQIVTIGGPVTLLTAAIFGLLMRLAIDTHWTVKDSVLLGIFCAPIYPATVVHLLRKQSTTTKQIAVLLQGEALFGICMSNVAYVLLILDLTDLVEHWYQYVLQLLRFVICGLLAGYLLGLAGRWFLRKTYTNHVTVIITIIILPFFTYALSERYLSGCGSISVAVVGLMCSWERTSLAREMNTTLLEIWEAMWYVVDVVLGTLATILLAVECLKYVDLTDHVLAMVTYLVYYAIRFNCFLLFSPVISRLGYGMDLKSMIVCVWSGVKCPFSMVLVRVFNQLQLREEKNYIFYFHVAMLYVYSNLINASVTRKIMDFLGLRNISMARQLNMNHCLKHIFKMRDRTIAILKMDKYLTDVNWAMVGEVTTIKHPYRMELQMEDEDDDFWGNQFQTCPECKNEIRQEPTAKEMKEMTREAKMRVLKAKKMFYSRQFENGMVSKEGIRILSQAVEMAMDTDEAVIEIEGLEKRFVKENVVNRCIRNRVHELKRSRGTAIRPPRKYLRRICYYIVMNKHWEKIMLSVVTLNVLTVATNTYFSGWLRLEPCSTRFTVVLDYAVTTAECIFAVIYACEFLLKIMAYSWVYVWRHGVRRYFRSYWNIQDFIVMLAALAAAVYDTFCMFGYKLTRFKSFRLAVNIIGWFRILRFLRIFEMFYPHTIRYLDRQVDMQLAVTFELGKNYASGETEILEMLPYMIDNDTIQSGIRENVERDRLKVDQLLSTVQKEKPWVAITVKTKQAIRTILKSMNDAMNQLRISGWVDDYELEKLNESMMVLYKTVNNIKTVRPSAPKVIFKEVAWMGNDEQAIDFLFENVIVKKFEPGDVVFQEGMVAKGIYIVVTGLFTISYNPERKALANLSDFGQLPIVDYFSGAKFEESSFEHIFSGNCIGELSTLTKRSYNCTIKADAHSQVYVLSESVLNRAMELSPDPVSGLQCRIWKEVAVRIAVPLLMSVAAYQNFSQDQIKYALERAFVPDLTNIHTLTVTDAIQDMLLIEGVAADYTTRDRFVAPCYIPRTIKKIILPDSSLMSLPDATEIKILIIPEKDMEEFNMSVDEYGTGDLVAVASSVKCLQHTAQRRIKEKKKIDLKRRPSAYFVNKEVKRKPSGRKSDAEEGTMFFKSNLPEVQSLEMKQKKVSSSSRL